MSNLQLGLLGIGVAVVAVVIAYNKWQERQYRRQAEAGFRDSHPDVLMQPPPAAETAGRRLSGSERIEPVFNRIREGHEAPRTKSEFLSEAIDFIIPIESAGKASQLLLAANAALADCPKSTGWEGFNEEENAWEPVKPGADYARMRVGMQLVDRRGSVSVDDLRAFAAGVEQAAISVGAVATSPDADSAHGRAAELDRFCGEVDIQIALHVVNDKAAFTGTKVRALAEAAGMVLGEDGKYAYRDDVERVLYTLSNQDPAPFQNENMKTLTTSGLTLALDVPGTPRGSFDAFQEFARQLSQALGARVVDDNAQPLGPAKFETLRAQLQSIYQAMENRGITAGGGIALRLFS